MAIPPLGSSLACAGITGSVRDQTLRGETASASGSDPVATVATRTFSGAGAEADATTLPPPESVTVPGAEESTKPKIYRLLESHEICEQLFGLFRVSRAPNKALSSIRLLVKQRLDYCIAQSALSKICMVGRDNLLGVEQKKSCYVDVAKQIIDMVGEGRSVKVVPTTLSEILERSPNAMRAVKAGVKEEKSSLEILDTVKAILEAEDVHSIPEISFRAFVTAVKVVLRGQRHEIERKLDNKDFRAFYPLAQKIAQMDTSSASNRPREASHVLPAPGAGAGTVLPSYRVLPVSLTAGEKRGVLERREDPRLDAAGAGAGIIRSKRLNPLLDSYEICEQIYAQFQVTRSLSQAAVSIRSLAEKKLNLQISRVALSKLFIAGRAILREEEQENSYYSVVARKIIDKVREGRPFKVVPTTLSEILERSPNAMRAVKAGVEKGELCSTILQDVKAILEAEDVHSIPEISFRAFVTAVKVVLRGQRHEIERKLYYKDFKGFYPLAQKIAQMDTSSASNRPREASHVLPAPGAGAGTVLPSYRVLPVSLTAGEITGLLERREDPHLDAAGAGAGVQGISIPLNTPFTATETVRNAQPNRTFSGAGAEAGTTTGAPKLTRPKILYRLLGSDEICEKINAGFQVTRAPKVVTLIQSLAAEKLNLPISRSGLGRLFAAGRGILLGEEAKNSYCVDVAQRIIDKFRKDMPPQVVPTTLSEILEGSPSAMRAIKAGVEKGERCRTILQDVQAILEEERRPRISKSYFTELFTFLKTVLGNPGCDITNADKTRYKKFYPLAKIIAQIEISATPKRPRETSPVLSGAGAGAGSEDISSEDSGSRGTQEERSPKRARTTSPDWAGIPDLPPSQSQRVPNETRTGDSQSAEASRRHIPRDLLALCDGGGDRLGALTSMGSPCAPGAGAGDENSPSYPGEGERDDPLIPLLSEDSGSRGTPSDVFLHDDPYAELFGAEDGASGGDFLDLLGDNDFAVGAGFSIEDSSPSAGQEEN